MKNLLLFSLFSLPFLLFAQKSEYNFGKVPAEILQMTDFPADTAAAAVVLEDYGDLRVVPQGQSYVQEFRRFSRTKILTRAGLDRADISIPYYHRNGVERIGEIRAVITLPGRQTYTLEKDDFFTEQLSDYWSMKKIALPNAAVGAVIDLYYELYSDRFVELREWEFQTDIPTVKSELTVDFDPHFSYLYLFQGFDNMQKKDEDGKTIVTDGETTAILDQKKFTVNNVPALRPEPFITTLDDYRLRIRFQCSEFFRNDGIKTQVLSDWESVGGEMFYAVSFGQQYTKKNNCGKVLKAAEGILSAEMPPKKKAIALYDFVNQNVPTANLRSMTVRKSLNDAFEKKSATLSEKNLMLVALLQEAEIDAAPMLVSTRGHGAPMPDYAIVDQFNHTIVYAEIDGKPYFIETGDDLRPFGELAAHSMNRSGFLIKKKAYAWKEIKPKKSKKMYLADFALTETGEIPGKITASYTGQAAAAARYDWLKNTEDKRVGFLADSETDLPTENLSAENETDFGKHFKVTAECNFTEFAQSTDSLLYFNPLLLTDYRDNPFKSEKRRYDIDYPYPFAQQLVVNFKYDAKTYAVEELPESQRFSLDNQGASVMFAAAEKAPGWIQLNYSLNVNQTRFAPYNYEAVRSFFERNAEKAGEQVVLRKL